MSQIEISAADNVFVSLVTGLLGFVAVNWVQIILFVFAAIHAYIAIDKWRYEKSLRVKTVKDDVEDV